MPAEVDHVGSPSRIDLLEAVAREGSILGAARSLGVRPQAALVAVESMNAQAEAALVLISVRTDGSGVAQLTKYGRKFLELVRWAEAQRAEPLELAAQPRRSAQPSSQRLRARSRSG